MHVQNAEPPLFEEGTYGYLNPRGLKIWDVLIYPVSAAGANEGGFGEVNQFQAFYAPSP